MLLRKQNEDQVVDDQSEDQEGIHITKMRHERGQQYTGEGWTGKQGPCV